MKSTHRNYALLIVLIIGVIIQTFKYFGFNTTIFPTSSFEVGIDNNDPKLFSNKTPDIESNDNLQVNRKLLTYKPSSKVHSGASDFPKQHTFGEASKNPEKKVADKKKTKKRKKKIAAKKPESIKKYITEDKKQTPQVAKNTSSDMDLGGPLGQFNNNKDPQATVPQTPEEWIEILLNFPDYKKLSHFIESYHSRLISPSVFYEVVDAMIADPRDEINLYAVKALGSTPSQQSFIVISELLEVSHITDKTKNTAKEQLNVYKSLQYLGVLKAIVASTDLNLPRTFAANLITQSAKHNLPKSKETNDVSTQDNEPKRTTATDNSRVIKNYEQTKELLSSLLNQPMDSQLNSAITEAINYIEDSLASNKKT
jgi:hypothetical protein